jgi:TonB-linked SusC/RagA family outer membrane protein
MKKITDLIGNSKIPGMEKLFRIMKLTSFFLMISAVSVLAGKTYSQTALLNLNMGKTTVKEVLSKIEDQSEFYFMYSGKVIDVNREVSVDVKNQKIDAVLNSLFAGTDVNYTIKDRIIVLTTPEVISKEVLTSFQQKSVSGKVIDTKNQPLPGVTVVLKGTMQGTVTSADGNYSLNIPEDATLVFSFVGMRTQEVVVGSQTIIDVKLEAETIGIEEVVTVGYGVQRKVNMTGAVSMINFDGEIENRPITNASQALGGRIPGVWVSQNSGKPGSDGALIRIRGWGTLNNSNPLIIIDGVEGNFNQLNPNDIESITVLKDAASAAIYGSKAANGVVLVVTKTGKLDERMQINLSSYYGIQSLGRRYNLINSSAENMRMTNQALVNSGGSPLYPDNLVSAFESGTDKFKYPNADWFDVLFENAPIHEHNLSIRGGTEKSSTFLSFNYLNQDGMIPNTNTERYGIRANMELNVNSWFKVDGRINYNRKISKEPYNDIVYGSLGRVFDMLSGVTPFTSPFTRDGKFGAVEAIDDKGNILYDNRNPLIDANNGKRTAEENFLSINASVEIKLSDFLNWRTTIASAGNWNLIDNYNQSLLGYTDSGIPMMTKNYNREGIEIARSQVSSLANNVFSTLNFNKSFAEIHEVSAIAGLQLEDQIIKNVYARRSMPPKEGLTQVDAGTSGIQGQGNMIGVRMFSYFGRINYALADKYLFEVNLRADASSRFKEGNRWGVFPGFSAGWRLNEEAFMENMDVFSRLKLRASWGQLGNQNIANFWPYLTIINQDNSLSYSYKGSFAPGAAVTSLVDENITWETTSSLDIGLDAGFLNNRINIEADYFHKKTTDIIVQLPIPLLMGGVTPPFENVGEMVNNGVEFIINYDNQSSNRDRFGYNFGLNATYINNEVTKFQGGESPDQLYLIREGYSYRTLYGYKAVGIYQSNQEALEHMNNNSYKPIAGNLKFEDLNSDGKLGFEDKQEIGNTIPKFTYGLNTSFKYQGFDLNLLFQGVAGVHGYNNNAFTRLDYENRTITTRWRDAWTPQNTDTDVPILYFNNSWDNLESSYWVKEISFLKLKNVQLGYDFPTQLISRLGVQKIYLYANVQNVFVIVDKAFEGYDPEKDSFSHGINQYPVSRIISLGLNFNF